MRKHEIRNMKFERNPKFEALNSKHGIGIGRFEFGISIFGFCLRFGAWNLKIHSEGMCHGPA